MAGREIIIGIDNERVYFNSTLSLPISHTNIPKEYLIFRSHQKLLWKVEMMHYTNEEKCLKVRVIDYEYHDIAVFDQQEPKKPIVKLIFEKLDWQNLEPLLSSYQKIHLSDFLINLDTNLFCNDKGGHTENKKLEPFHIPQICATPLLDDEIKIVSEDFWLGFSDIQFKLGYVTLRKKIKGVYGETEFKIINENLLAEFENVKFWFAKILKTRKIKVITTVTLKGTTITDTNATSVHIDKITPELIDSVKYQRTYGLTKPSKIKTIDKSLFTAEDIFDQFEADNTSGNAFQQTELDILALLSDKSSIRNKKQLAYLAGGKQTERQKLRYTLHPHFGFVFLIEGEKNNHFVWELLNSHATYIWSIGKSEMDIALQYKRIESIVNNVRTAGRDEYKKAYHNNHQDQDLVFNVIEHRHADSQLQDGFLKWKNRLNEMLI
jgi:hypothetical protein